MMKKNQKIQHAVGEIVLGGLGNFFEDPKATRKNRPLVVLAAGNCQHIVAGLTTQPYFRTTGFRRASIPNPTACGLNGPGYLWGSRPARVSRLDIRKHLGWVDHDMVQVLAETMHLPPAIVSQLWHSANHRHEAGTWHLGA